MSGKQVECLASPTGPEFDPVEKVFVHSMAGRELGHYELIEQIGAGGMGEVYRAHDLNLDRDVALKILPAGLLADASPRRRFRREALLLSKLNHPNIASIFDFATEGDVDFLVMELIQGQALSERLKSGPLDEREITRLGLQLAEGLAAAHAKGVVHRDLKPANLIILPDGRLKILDFGLAAMVPARTDVERTRSLTKTSDILGTLPYMSPEQLRGQDADPRSDIYGAGTVLYEMAAGRRPFPQTQSAELIGAILHATPEAPSSLNRRIPPALASITMKALEKDPGRRYQTARELMAALEALGSGTNLPITGAESTNRKARQVRAAASGGLLIILLAGLSFAMNWGGWRDRLLSRNSSGKPGVAANRADRPVRVRRSVAILGFKNLSGRPDDVWFSTALSEMLTTELGAGGELRIIPGETVARMKADLTLVDTDGFARDTLRRVQKRLGTDFVVIGAYIAEGPQGSRQVRLDLRLQETVSGDTLASISARGGESNLDELVSRAGIHLRETLGLTQITSTDAASVRASLPSNAEATRLYSLGLRKLLSFDPVGARDDLVKAVALEPQFPLAHAALGEAWYALGYDSRAVAEAKSAFEHAEQLNADERLWVEGAYRVTVADWGRAVEVYQTLFNNAPDNIDCGVRLAQVQSWAFRGKEALETVARLRRLPTPLNEDPRIDLREANADETLGDFAHEEAVTARGIEKARAQGARLMLANLLIRRSWALQNLGRLDEALGAAKESQEISAAVGDEHGQAAALEVEGDALYRQGHITPSVEAFRRAMEMYRRVGNQRGAGGLLGNLAVVLIDQGELAQARKYAEQSVAMAHEVGNVNSKSAGVENLGVIQWMQGDLAAAKKTYADALILNQKTGDRQNFASTMEGLGEIALAEGNLEEAQKRFESALAAREQIGEKPRVADTQLAIARLMVEMGKSSQGEPLARQSRDEFHAEGSLDDEAYAASILASTMLAQGRVEEAAKETAAADAAAAKTQNIYQRAVLGIIAGRTFTARGDYAEARRRLDAALADATKHGYMGLEFEARLALGQLEVKSGSRAAGRARLARLEAEAVAKDHLLVARKTAALIE